MVAAWAGVGAVRAEQAAPSFPDRTVKVTVLPFAAVGPRAGEPPPIPPFSWDQSVLVREGASFIYTIEGFDPGFNPVSIVRSVPPVVELDPAVSTFEFNSVIVSNWERRNNQALLQVPTLLPTFFSDTTSFDVHVGELSDTATDYALTVKVNPPGDFKPIRPRPTLTRSAGFIFPPGNIVRYQWTGQGSEYQPDFLVDFSGRTGAAETAGVTSSTVVNRRAIKVRPLVLGHHLMLVTPWNPHLNAIERQRGSQSNGAVFECGFGSANLAPVSDGLLADTFFPAAGSPVSNVTPNAVDPETATNAFAGSEIDWGDGTVDNLDTHTYTDPGIFKAVAQVEDPDDAMLFGQAEDLFVVDATLVRSVGPGAPAGTTPRVTCSVSKQIPIREGGIGEEHKDTLTMRWSGIGAAAGEWVVFALNRNRFGRMPTDPVPGPGEIDDRIILGANRRWSGRAPNAEILKVSATATSIVCTVQKADLDRTGDPRLGGVETKDDFLNQLVAICIVPADLNPSNTRCYRMDPDDVLRLTAQGGKDTGFFDPEIKITAKSYAPKPLLKLLDPNGSEILLGGDTFDVTWQSFGAVGNVDLTFSDDNGKTWQDLAIDTPNDGEETVTIPAVASNKCRMRIRPNGLTKPEDKSDKNFIVVVP